MNATDQATETTTRKRKGTLKCGFCSTEHHETCPSGVRNGNGTIARCTCGCERSRMLRCTECNNRTQEEIGTDWRCLDRDACEAEIQRRLDADPVMKRIRASMERTHDEDRLRRAEREARKYDAAHDPNDPLYEVLNAPDISAPTKRGVSRGTPKATTGACLCCGEATRGGKFLPGHDSKLLTRYAERVVAGEITREDAVSECMKISQALAKKAQVRIDRAKLRAAVR